MAEAGEDQRMVGILFVCTANRVRSPFAEAVARGLVERHRLPVVVASAGLKESGRLVVGDMVDAAAGTGIDIADHVSRQVDVALLNRSDLIVTMTGEHVVDLVGLDPGSIGRTLTLREFAAAAERDGGPRWEPGAVRSWAREVTDRPMGALLSGDLDVSDPIGGPRKGYRRAAQLISELLEQGFGAG